MTILETLLLSNEVVEEACREWHDNSLRQGQYTWDKLVELEDHRLTRWRSDMRAALKMLADFIEKHQAQ